jgi:hypothetical protein
MRLSRLAALALITSASQSAAQHYAIWPEPHELRASRATFG